MEAADQTKFTLVSCEVFSNGLGGKEGLDRFNDVIALKPDVLSILIGVNDVWHNVGAKKEIDFAGIETTYDKMLADTRTALPDIKIVLCEPFILRGSANTAQWAEWEAATKKIQQVSSIGFGSLTKLKWEVIPAKVAKKWPSRIFEANHHFL